MVDGRSALRCLITTEDAEIFVWKSLAGTVSSGMNFETGTVPVAKAGVVKLTDALGTAAVDRMIEGEEAVANLMGTEVAFADDSGVGAEASTMFDSGAVGNCTEEALASG